VKEYIFKSLLRVEKTTYPLLLRINKKTFILYYIVIIIIYLIYDSTICDFFDRSINKLERLKCLYLTFDITLTVILEKRR